MSEINCEAERMIKIKNKRSGLCEVTLEGELTIYEAADLKQGFEKHIDKCKAMTVDLSNVSEMDTACFQVLLAVKRECVEQQKEFTMNSHSPAVLDVLELFNIGSYFGDPLILSAE